MEEEEKQEEIVEKPLSKKEQKKEKKRIKKEEKIAKKEERKTKKKKIRLKKKAIMIPVILLLVIILGVGGYFGYKSYKKSTVAGIKKVYSENVIIKQNAKLYDKNHKEVGTILKGFELDLESLKKFTFENRFLKIKDSDYYVSYKDIKKRKIEEQKEESSYYVPLEKQIETEKQVVLYDDKKEAITLKKGIKTSLVSMDEKNYYISLFNKTLRIAKSKDIKETDKKLDVKKADHVSVIYYERVEDNCGEDNCLKTASVKAHINKLKENGYYLISKEDYIKYLNGYINLKEKAVLLTVQTVNDPVKAINDELKLNITNFEEKDGIKLNRNNKTSHAGDDKNSINAYQAKHYTVIDNYTRMAAGEEVADNGDETPYNQGIPVLNYHFFYDESKGEYEWCQESICLEKQKFKEHLEWLKNNGYKTLTIHEFADWMDEVIEVPEKSVLITIDDGARGTGKHNGDILIPLLEEYQEHATLFLIAGWWDIANYQSPYLDVQSHTFNLHYEASCADGRGKVACSDYATVKADLQQSLDVIRDNTSFCFPFYSSDRESLQAISELGFRVAFVGGSTPARRTNNKLLIPRYPIMDDISMNEFISIVS